MALVLLLVQFLQRFLQRPAALLAQLTSAPRWRS
jgi:hypothetical protein